MSRTIKVTLIVAAISLLAVGVGLILYFTIGTKDTYHVVALEHSENQVSDFAQSELKFFADGTFHIKIVHQTDGTYFLGVGTFTKQNADYVLTFHEARGNRTGTMTTYTYTDPVVCTKSGNRLKFTGYNDQIYYFG